jgi:hypothetical protein
MSAGPKITSAAGLRRAQVFALSADGYPDGDQSGADPYDGFELEGVKSFSLTLPENQIIVHLGNDRPFATDYLAPNNGLSGEVRTAKQNLDADATLTDTLTEEIGEMTIGGLATEKIGTEIDVTIIFYRQALDTTRGASNLRRWQMHILPICRLVPRGGGADQGGADENIYSLVPSGATKYPWGHAFTELDEGFTEAAWLRGTAENPVIVDRWTGNNTLTEFNLSKTPISVAKTQVFVEGTAATVSSVDTSGDTVTLNSAPGYETEVVAVYETSDAI